eukprot:c24507_g2_i1 orf=412-1464(-)
MTHVLELLQESPSSGGVFICNLCWEKGSGPVYHCRDCKFDLHVACVATGEEDTHFFHCQHPLRLLSLAGRKHFCDGCGLPGSPWMYRCHSCDYDMHAHCIRTRRFIQHPSHEHVLTLVRQTQAFPVEPQCNCCGKTGNKLLYTCMSCRFILHPACSMLPINPLHCKHLQHRLRLLTKPAYPSGSFTCDECGRSGTRWVYHCTTCRFDLHPNCANLWHRVPAASERRNDTRRNDNNCASTSSGTIGAAKQLSVTSNGDAATTQLLSSTELHEALRVMKILVQHYQPILVNLASPSQAEDDKEICPTCLEGFDTENPKTNIICGHGYHLACIMNWHERSDYCPVCRKKIAFK